MCAYNIIHNTCILCVCVCIVYRCVCVCVYMGVCVLWVCVDVRVYIVHVLTSLSVTFIISSHCCSPDMNSSCMHWHFPV